MNRSGKYDPAPRIKNRSGYKALNESDKLPYTGTGRGISVMIYMHDTLGLGRLRRNLKISRALKMSYPDLSIVLITGSTQAGGFPLPDAVRIVELPPLRKVGDSDYEPRFPGISRENIFSQRARILQDTIRELSPHIFIADHSHLSMNNEILPCLKILNNRKNPCIKILGIRGIIDDPAKVIRIWNDQGIHDVLRNLYDYIFIYTTPQIINPVFAYDFPDDIKEKVYFCGYITEQQEEVDSISPDSHSTKSAGKSVMVTIGGGEYWGEIVIGNFLKAIRAHLADIPFKSFILTGPFIPDELWNSFYNESQDLPVEILKFTPDTRPYIKRSDLVISTGGYNTITDILSNARKAIVIPRIRYRVEQLIRAKRLDELGLVKFIHPDDVTPESLYENVISMLEDDTEPIARARSRNELQLDGTRYLTEMIGQLFEKVEKSGNAGL
jgi:predicted glycosyltransferase